MINREYSVKLGLLRGLMREKGVDAILLNTHPNFAWLTCGKSCRIVIDSDKGAASLYVTGKTVELLTNDIEKKRFMEEETAGLPFNYVSYPWTGNSSSYLKGRSFASDDGVYGSLNLGPEIQSLRWSLQPVEIKRFRESGRKAAEVFDAAARAVRPGWTERRLAAFIEGAVAANGFETSVLLIGSDERLKRFRHPVTKDKKIKKTIIMVLCSRGYGLVSSLTRMISFGPVPAEMRARHIACMNVECAMWEATKPGAKIGDVFKACEQGYAEQGFPGEWKKHHQGGPAGYDVRDYLGVPGDKHIVQNNQAFAWNPSIDGAKSEDTILITEKKPEILTYSSTWPMVTVEHNGKKYMRYDIMKKKR